MQPATTAAIGAIPGVEPGLRDRLITDLNQNLANLTDLAAAYKQAHWNVTGPDFAQLHALFDEFTDQTRQYMDLLAERAVTLGGLAHGTIQAAVERTNLPPFPREERDEFRLLEELARRLDRAVADLRQGVSLSANETVTQDVYLEVTRGVEKQRWMVLAHLARGGGGYQTS